MHLFFPIIQEDELFFSLIARYHERSLNKSARVTLNQLGITKINPLVPKNIHGFLKDMKIFEIPEDEYFLSKHTMVVYFSNFLPSTLANELRQHMTKGLIGSRLRNLKYNINSSKLNYCPDCVIDDYKFMGETYWRLSHQLPTGFICLKHKTFFKTLNLNQDKIFLSTISMNDVKTSNDLLSKQTLFYATKFTHQSLILNKLILNLFEKINRGKLYLLFVSKGYVKSNGTINVVKLMQETEKHYGKSFLKISGFNYLIFNDIENLPTYCDMNMTYTEVLIFVNLFFDSLSAFMLYRLELPDREKGPFPCLNYFCEKYKQSVINNVHIYIDDKKGSLVISFICSYCMNEYEKFFRLVDRHLIYTIFHRTTEWKIGALDLIYNKGLSIEKASNKLHINSIEMEKLLKENLIEKWFENVDLAVRINTSYNLAVRDKQVLFYLKSIVRKAILFGRKKVYFWLLIALDKADIKKELPYLVKTNKYIEKHELFYYSLK